MAQGVSEGMAQSQLPAGTYGTDLHFTLQLSVLLDFS